MHSYLALFPNRNIAAFLLEHEEWKEMLRSADRESATPLRGLIAFMPGKLNHHYHYTGPLKSEGREGGINLRTPGMKSAPKILRG